MPPPFAYQLGYAVDLAVPACATCSARSRRRECSAGYAKSRSSPAALLPFDLVECLAGIPESIDSRWDAAIHANLKQDLLDLVLGEAVL